MSLRGKTAYLRYFWEPETDFLSMYLSHDVVRPDVRGGGDVLSLGALGLGGPEQGGAEHGGQVVEGHLVDGLLLGHAEGGRDTQSKRIKTH